MIKLNRTKENRWIFQKNINSSKLILEFLSIINKNSKNFNFENMKKWLKSKNLYHGRSDLGSNSTMGVRLSEICFYMFGYVTKNNDEQRIFVPSPTTTNIFHNSNNLNISKNTLINLFLLQFPHPFSKTNKNFKIFVGRFLLKLLTDKRIDNKLYIDEIIWFLPFIEKIDVSIYENLIDSIIEFRKLDFSDKLNLFKSIKNCDNIFSNVTHEINYYFLRIFESLGVLKITDDKNHNNGNLLKFKHGNTNTFRTDAWKSKAKHSGFISINENLYNDVLKLVNKFSPFETPISEGDNNELTHKEWLNYLYEKISLEYIRFLNYELNKDSEISQSISKMIHESKYGTKDGSSFEKSILPIIKMFEQTIDAEIRSGAGNTDIICIMDVENDKLIKINIEAKTRKNSLNEINSRRIENHLQKHGSEFCIVVSHRFAKGVNYDIMGCNIVLINVEDFGNYCLKGYKHSKNGYVNFLPLLKIIRANLGKNITENVREHLNNEYGLVFNW